jgi:hypothetical protein
MGEVCDIHVRNEKFTHTNFWWENLKKSDQLEDLYMNKIKMYLKAGREGTD